MARIGTRSLTISIGATEYNNQTSDAHLEVADSDSDFVTFADAATGGAKDYKLVFTAAQDMATGSLWRKMFDSPGTTVACILRPYGNATASATQPHLTFNAVISLPDGTLIGGEADSSTTAVFQVECEWALIAPPTLVSA